MDVNGSLASQHAREKLWDTLTNVDNWKKALPQPERLDKIGDNSYELEVKVDFGLIKGNQTIKIDFTDLQRPNSFGLVLHHSMVKETKGTFELKDPGETVEGVEAPNPLPDGTQTVVFYKLHIDAGNPFVNNILDSFKDRVKSGFDELLSRLDKQA